MRRFLSLGLGYTLGFLLPPKLLQALVKQTELNKQGFRVIWHDDHEEYVLRAYTTAREAREIASRLAQALRPDTNDTSAQIKYDTTPKDCKPTDFI